MFEVLPLLRSLLLFLCADAVLGTMPSRATSWWGDANTLAFAGSAHTTGQETNSYQKMDV